MEEVIRKRSDSLEGNFKNDQPVGEFRYYTQWKLKAIIRHTNDGHSSEASI
jgi:hypothetical protein